MAHELYGHAKTYISGQRLQHIFLEDQFDQKLSVIEDNAIKNFNNR